VVGVLDAAGVAAVAGVSGGVEVAAVRGGRVAVARGARVPVGEPAGVPARVGARRGVPASSERVRAGVLPASERRGRVGAPHGAARGRERVLARAPACRPSALRGASELCRAPCPSAYRAVPACVYRRVCERRGEVRLSPLRGVIPCRIDGTTWHRYP
jgi:hypothetical protein